MSEIPSSLQATIVLSGIPEMSPQSSRPASSWKDPLGLFFLLLTVSLLVAASACSYLQPAPPNGKLEVDAVSWKLVKKRAEPDAGLSGRKITVLNPSDQSVVATKTTDSSGIVDFDLPPGTYTLLGASDEPQSVQIQSGQTTNFKIVMH
jgi:hypothetical protein